MTVPAPRPFHPYLSRALLAPPSMYATVAVAMALDLHLEPPSWLDALLVILSFVLFLTVIVSVPWAIWLLLRDGRYRTRGNIATTFVGSLPFLMMLSLPFFIDL